MNEVVLKHLIKLNNWLPVDALALDEYLKAKGGFTKELNGIDVEIYLSDEIELEIFEGLSKRTYSLGFVGYEDLYPGARAERYLAILTIVDLARPLDANEIKEELEHFLEEYSTEVFMATKDYSGIDEDLVDFAADVSREISEKLDDGSNFIVSGTFAGGGKEYIYQNKVFYTQDGLGSSLKYGLDGVLSNSVSSTLDLNHKAVYIIALEILQKFYMSVYDYAWDTSYHMAKKVLKNLKERNGEE